MEKITKVYEVYDFEELAENIKNNLIEVEKQNQIEIYNEYSLYNDLQYEAGQLINKYFNKNNKIELDNLVYSFNYCQGDGGGFEFNGYYKNKFFRVKHCDNFYYYYKTFKIIDDWDFTDKEREQLEKKVYNMLKEFERIGWDLVNFVPDVECCIEYLKKHKYLKDGTIF